MKTKANKLTYPVLVVLILALGLFSSCGKNRLKTDEKSLTKQILTEEEQLTQEATLREQREKQLADSLAKLPKGFQFKEDRSVDPNHQPVVIDIAGTNENIKDFKLSGVASSVKYIRMETPPDSMLLWFHPKLNSLMPTVISDDKHLFIQGLYGVTRFNMDGKFQETILKNESGISADKNFVSWNPREVFGVMPNNPVSLFNGNLYLRFQDGGNGQVQIISKKIQDDLVLNNPALQQETGKDILTGDRLLTIKEENVSKRYPIILGLDRSCWAGIHDSWNSAETGNLFVVFNNNGDTLCTISSPNQIKNWTKSLVRAGEPFTYYYKNQLTYLGQYSDTLFRFIPPNRLLPVYILDLGKDKVGFYEGVDPDTDLTQKLMLYSIFETNNFIFIRYTRNSASPGNLQNKSVTFYNCVFDKKKNKLYHLPEQNSTPQNLVNDVDGGISFWPEFVTPGENIMMLFTGQKIKEYVKSAGFKNGTFPQEQRQKQIEMAQGLKNNDLVVMIVR